MVFSATLSNILVISWQPFYLRWNLEYPDKAIEKPQVTDKLYHTMMYREHLIISRISGDRHAIIVNWNINHLFCLLEYSVVYICMYMLVTGIFCTRTVLVVFFQAVFFNWYLKGSCNNLKTECADSNYVKDTTVHIFLIFI